MRRLIIALVAVLIAAGGGVLTYLYAAGADARAMAEMQPMQVLVVAEPIAAGTPAESLTRSIVVDEIPASAVVPGAISALSDVAGLQTSDDLNPGEQLISARFVAPEAVQGEVDIPKDMHLLSIQLAQQRVIGGELRPGDTVAIFASGTVSGTGPDGEDTEADMTHLILHKVLVTSVQGAVTVETDENGEPVEQPAADELVVTVALTAPDAELVVFSQEFASIWLSLEGPDVPEEGTRVVTPEDIFQ